MISLVRRVYNRVVPTGGEDRASFAELWLPACWIAVGFLYLRATKQFANVIVRQWPAARGWEYEWIGTTLASGHGYAFYKTDAWLGPYATGSEYSLSAWTDPFQTFIIAAAFFFFGEHGRLVLVLLNVMWVTATAVVIVLCCRRISTLNIALLTAALFVLGQVYVSAPWLYIGNVALAMFVFSLCALCLIRALETADFRRALTLGVILGVTHLVHAASILFGPALASILLVRWGIRRSFAWKNAIAVTVIPLVMITPWAMRNYFTFQEFVPIRTGFGWQAYIGNVALAMTLAGRSTGGQAEPPWTARTPREAVTLVRDLNHEAALRAHAMTLEVAKAPTQYASYNEAQRDSYFAALAASFMRENPLLAAKLTLWKMHTFLFGWGVLTTIITVGALGGFLARWRDVRVLGLCALICAYMVPYVISVAFYYRYRAPLDPIVFLLIGCLLSTAQTVRPTAWRRGPLATGVHKDLAEAVEAR